ncbi:hypothetical protein BDV23DRAFT_170210 [Aspergillus alliaceus]|uniref:Uncharacterized protein n=1 Tax=Petromyces alliaceus TaxID=209559 RepID=A0A5N7CH76_PETAA|nr:hypothetical protein BDV23DRAFT_170210 [Aspergillus alliaceus]
MGCKYSISIIQRNLTGSISECGPDKLLTTRLFFTIASPLAMAQLQELLGSMQQNNNILPIPELDSVDGMLNALCISQGSSLIASIQTRLHLINLVESYKQKRMQYQRDSQQAFTNPETIARITSKRFPLLERDAPEFSRNWHMLALEFGKSIVYFLPSRGEFEISNTMHLTPLLVSNKYQNATLTIFWKSCVKSVVASSKSISNKHTEF